MTVLAVVGGAVVSSPVAGQDTDDGAGRGPAAVTLAVGGDASGPEWPGCSSEHCRHLTITLQGAPAGVYDIECWSSRDNTPWYSGRWRWPSSELWTQGGCWFGYPGEDVWVVVGGTKSNVIRWDQADAGSRPQTADPATGRYTAVSAGVWHSCGLRADGTITCWGLNEDGQTDAPVGRYTAVSAGGFHSCGLRTDSTITCWGDYTEEWTYRFGPAEGQVQAPAGRFGAIAVSGWHACGLRTDDTITCWGENNHWRGGHLGQADAPAGRFGAVAVGAWHSCGVRTDGTITCWGLNEDGQTDAPVGRYTAVSAGGLHSCGLRTDSTITCWGSNGHGQADAPVGRYTAVSAGDLHSCGLLTDGTIVCWGFNNWGQRTAPSGQFVSVAAGGTHSCGLRSNGTITCWGTNSAGQLDVPTESAADSGGGVGGSSAAPEYSVPGPPRNLRLSLAGDRLSIRWDAPHDDGGEPVTGYVVQVSRPRLSSSIGSAQRFIERQGRSLQVSDVDRGTTYTVSVRARNSRGSGAFVSKEIFTGLTLGPPEIAVEQEGRTFWIDDPDAVVVWDRVIDAVAYDIDWRYMEVDIDSLRRVYGLLNNPGLTERDRERLTQEAATLIDGEELHSRTFGGDSRPDLSGGIEARCSVVSQRNVCHNFVTGGTVRFDADDPSYRIHSSQPDKLLQVRVRTIGTGYAKGDWSEWAYHPASRFNVVCQFLDIWNRVDGMRTALKVAGFVLTIGSVVGAAFSAGATVAGRAISAKGIQFAAREIVRVMFQSALSRQFILGLIEELVKESIEEATLKIFGVAFGCMTHGAQLDESQKRSLWEEMVDSLVFRGALDAQHKTKVIQSFALFSID